MYRVYKRCAAQNGHMYSLSVLLSMFNLSVTTLFDGWLRCAHLERFIQDVLAENAMH
jgi:hypothetical protein